MVNQKRKQTKPKTILQKNKFPLFITVEGGEGAGKSTLIANLKNYLESQGKKVVTTREPGGTALGEAVRALLLHSKEAIDPKGELFLFLAARVQHLKELIIPALIKGHVVLCDRFTDSTIAYQSTGRGLDYKDVEAFCAYATSGLIPDVTFYLDLAPKEGLKRRKSDAKLDRIESENYAFHEKVRKSFLSLAKNEPKRIHVLNAHKPKEDVFEQAKACLDPFL